MKKLQKYSIENDEIIYASSAKQFINRLRKGSYFDYNNTNLVYKYKFAQRYKTVTGKQIECDLKDDDAFVSELIKHGFIKSVESLPLKKHLN